MYPGALYDIADISGALIFDAPSIFRKVIESGLGDPPFASNVTVHSQSHGSHTHPAMPHVHGSSIDPQSAGQRKRAREGVDLGGCRIIKKKREELMPSARSY
jgi:hypothetical protein